MTGTGEPACLRSPGYGNGSSPYGCWAGSSAILGCDLIHDSLPAGHSQRRFTVYYFRVPSIDLQVEIFPDSMTILLSIPFIVARVPLHRTLA